jgi:hypothetical protein
MNGTIPTNNDACPLIRTLQVALSCENCAQSPLQQKVYFPVFLFAFGFFSFSFFESCCKLVPEALECVIHGPVAERVVHHRNNSHCTVEQEGEDVEAVVCQHTVPWCVPARSEVLFVLEYSRKFMYAYWCNGSGTAVDIQVLADGSDCCCTCATFLISCYQKCCRRLQERICTDFCSTRVNRVHYSRQNGITYASSSAVSCLSAEAGSYCFMKIFEHINTQNCASRGRITPRNIHKWRFSM